MTSTNKDVYWKLNSLASLASGLIGHYVIVDLRNDASANGKIEQIDGFVSEFFIFYNLEQVVGFLIEIEFAGSST